MIFKAIKVLDSRVSYTEKTRANVVQAAKKLGNKVTLDALRKIWYEAEDTSINTACNYDRSRYHALNLHSFFSDRGQTVEFRMFNATLHAGKVKAYIHLALGISAQAITQKSARLNKTTSDNLKYTFRTWLLTLGFIGKEFESTRKHLMTHLNGNSAWRFGNATA